MFICKWLTSARFVGKLAIFTRFFPLTGRFGPKKRENRPIMAEPAGEETPFIFGMREGKVS
ncbi:hypothetical protein C1N62_07490 [Nissabacter sp. SGAir0207]|nr:hypothetical protein C1N62_07490 [Nissabacter sp. SGAir0207]